MPRTQEQWDKFDLDNVISALNKMENSYTEAKNKEPYESDIPFYITCTFDFEEFAIIKALLKRHQEEMFLRIQPTVEWADNYIEDLINSLKEDKQLGPKFYGEEER